MAYIKAADEQTQKYYDFLEELRQTGKINMMGARTHLANRFGLGYHPSSAILRDWMNAHNKETV